MHKLDNQPMVSIVIPVYNVEKYLERCVNSVIKQKYSNIEIILIDDGSTDSSGKICDNFVNIESRIKVIHQNNRGLSAARNVGIEASNGEYICFVDSDDYISSDYINIMLIAAIENNCDVVVSSYAMGENGAFKFDTYERPNHVNLFSSREALGKWHGKYRHEETVAWNKLYHSRLFDSEIRYPEGKIFEDVVTTHLLVNKAKNVCFISNKLYYYYRRKNSIQGSNDEKKALEKIKMQDIRLKWFKDNGYYNAYNRLLSKNLKYNMQLYVYATSLENEMFFLEKFNELFEKNKYTFTLLDRILFEIFKRDYKIIKKIINYKKCLEAYR